MTRVLTIKGLNAVVAGLILCLLSACATEDIVVAEVAMTDRPDAAVVGWTADESGREVFSSEDEEVTIKVLFDFNYRGVYEWYKIEWIAPGGVAYKVVATRTDFASHRDLQASLKIRGKMASRLPGLWRVRVSLRGRDGAPDRELVSRLFRIAEPTAQMIAAGLTPVDAPDPSLGRPLASYSRTAIDKPQDTAPVPATASPAVVQPDGAPQPGVAAAQVLPAATAASTDGAASRQAAQEFGVLAPLGIVPASSVPPVAPDTALAAGAQAASTASDPATTTAVKPAVANVTLRATPPDPATRSIPPRTRNYVGCPPLYYRPGPGCVEQAPEE